MPNLFTWFQNYLNPSKLTAVTVPGMIVAFALVLILGPVPCRQPKGCPYCSSTLKPPSGDTTAGTKNTGAAAAQSEIGPAASSTGNGADQYVQASNGIIADESTVGDINGALCAVGVRGKSFNPTTKQCDANETVGANAFLAQAKKEIDIDPSLLIGTNADCELLPRYIVTSTLKVMDAADKKKADAAATKAGQKLWKVSELIAYAKECNSELNRLSEVLQERSSYFGGFITQAGTDLTGLSSNLTSAQNSGETLTAKSLQEEIQRKREFLAWAQGKQAALKNATNLLQALQSRVQVMASLGQTAPTAAAPDGSAATSTFTTIQQNLLAFIFFSLIIGVMLDPIQRGAVSFFGPRRKLFGAFNLVYGQAGDGEFRYGDRRLPPWVSDQGHIAEPKHEEMPYAETWRTTPNSDRYVTKAELRTNVAFRAFAKDRNIYDKNYAIGAGYISQSEAKMLEDDYFAQSQITSGLILPLLILSICIGLRSICCTMPVTSTGDDYFWITASMVVVSVFGVLVGLLFLMPLALLASSERFLTLCIEQVRRFFTDLKSPKNQIYTWSVTTLCLVISCGGILALHAGYTNTIATGAGIQKGPTLGSMFLAMVPALLIGPFWYAGLDRLHKYYSELQSRIAGNILRVGATTEQKFIELLSDPVAACAMRSRFQTTVEARRGLERVLGSVDCREYGGDAPLPGDDEDPGPAGPAAPTTPPGQPSGGGNA